MRTAKSFLFAVSVSLAMALTFSCTDESGSEDDDSSSSTTVNGGDSSSSVATTGGNSSSSAAATGSSSSSSAAATGSSSSSSVVVIPEVEWPRFVLSYAGNSYVDIEGKKTYKQSEVEASETIAESIDLVAYHTQSAGNKIYGPAYITVTQESFARIFKTEDELYDAEDNDDGEVSIAIADGSVFYLESSEGYKWEVIVEEMGDNYVVLSASPL